MSYQGGYPYPPTDAGQSNIGFASNTHTGQGGGFSYPQGGSGFPCPPSVSPGFSNLSSAPSPNLPYSVYPSSNPSPNFSSPYPHPPVQHSTTSPYPPPVQQSTTSSYPPSSNFAPYPPQYNATSAYAPPPPNAPFPPVASSSAYQPPSNAPFPPSNTSNIYPAVPMSGSNMPPPAQNYSYPPQNQIVSNPQNVSFYGASAAQSNTSTGQYTAGSMWPYQERPTIRQAQSFDPSSDAAQLRKAMKGFGTNEVILIQIIGRRTNLQRQQIMQRYQQSFGRDLMKDLKSELSGQFYAVIAALITPLAVYLAKELYEAISGIGTNEKTLIEILCTNDNNTLRNLKMEYQRHYGKPIEADLRGDTSGDFRKLMVAMAAAYRDEASNCSLAPGLAQSLYNAGAKKMGTNEAEFTRILASYSYPCLRCVFQEYRNVSGGKTFDAAIRSELSGDYRDGMLAIYECINNRAAFYAKYIHESMRGMGTNDKALIRIIVSRSEIDMGNIKDEYRKAYGKRLEDSISNDTSGDYKKMLLALIQG